ncbi:MMPL family transporter, partial [Candidatus Acetothermia bacterium]|nr:MMPL family transporter [Candidatus Acetothermia bacterium]
MQFLRRLQERIVDHPWLTIGAVLIITAVFIYYIPQVQFESDFKKSLPKGDPAVQALDRAEKIYGSQDFFSVLIETPDTIFKVPTIEKIQKMETELKALEIVDKNGKAIRGIDDVRGPTTATVISATEKTLTIEKAAEILPKTPEEMEAYRQKVLGDSNLRNAVVSEDGKAAAILIKLNPYLDDSNVFVDKVNQVVAKYQGPDMKIYVGGIPQIRDSIQQSMRGDLGLLIPLVILIMEIVLLFAFRTGRGVGLPFLLMVLATIWTVGTMAITRSQMTAFSFFMPVMLIIASKAYAIYTVNRYYEEAMHHGKLPKREIILNTMNDMAKPLFMDGLTEIAGFLSLLAASFWPQQSFGLFIAVGIFYTFVLNFTLIPAILAVLPVSKKQYDYEHGWLPNALAGFGRFIDRQRGWVIGVSAVLLIGFAVAIPHLKVETTPQSFLGPNHPALIASNALERDFGGS